MFACCSARALACCTCMLQLCVYADAALTRDTQTLRLETAVGDGCHRRKASSTRRELPAARLEGCCAPRGVVGALLLRT